MSNIKLINYHYKGEKRKNKGHSRGLVIRLMQLWKDFYPKFKSDHI